MYVDNIVVTDWTFVSYLRRPRYCGIKIVLEKCCIQLCGKCDVVFILQLQRFIFVNIIVNNFSLSKKGETEQMKAEIAKFRGDLEQLQNRVQVVEEHVIILFYFCCSFLLSMWSILYQY